MLWTLLAMLLVMLVAAVVVVYVAYPHRGEDVPHAPWLGEAIKKGVEALPTLEDELTPQAQPVQRRDGHSARS